MESSGLILPKFIKFLSNAETKFDYLDISTAYERITAYWTRRDHITAYLGDRAWKLEVKARKPNRQRKTILEGWIQLREDLGLAVGDVLILECPTNSRHHFSLQVIKQAVA
ncbi:hypothetical protein DCAR_0208084 [Daucus carota subsp. sativus]|uniref:Uncharacterized protein n=1 Tax=Daucus carota subsp. sativus TaxID=79200 RepID=A0A161X5T9_DAUCS|nr:hypothetical protein DCAR_0208084 [Daucus carota subsp. sativus]